MKENNRNMTATFETHKLGILSTNHLTPTDARTLETLLATLHGNDSFLVYTAIGADEFFEACILPILHANFSETFKTIIMWARREEFSYLLFDGEGIEYVDLFPIFDGEG
ncbi:hypothetical protein ACQ4M3_20730 [Leptolyngbya sp. AN03gr2]|uniref:DUF5983 family protein n=1 Tax=unclassified Leptolyngbya TaxID=2650499 RepID=UPI003D319B8C